jgi:hypothetical protein
MKLCFAGAAAASVPIDAPTVYVSNDWGARQILIKRGVQPMHLEDAFTPQESDDLAHQVATLAARWHYADKHDLTQWNGLSLGAPMDWMLWWQIFMPVFKFVTGTARLLQKTAPSEIVWGPGLDPRWQAAMLAARDRWATGAPAQYLTDQTIELNTNLAQHLLNLPTITPRHRLVFTASNVVSAVTGRGKHRRRSVMHFNYQTLDKVVVALLRDPARRFNVLFANRPTHNQLWLDGVTQGARFLLPARYTLTSGETRELAQLQNKWREISATSAYQSRFCWSGVDAWPIFKDTLDQVFSHDLLPIAQLARGYQQTFSQDRPACITLPTDAPYLHRIAVEAGRSMDIPSVVLLHGLPPSQDHCGQYQQAKYVFAWGPATRDVFTSLGSPADRIKLVGFPALDACYRHKDKYAQLKASRSIPTLMILGQPINTHVTILGTDDESGVYMQTILQALEGLKGFRLIIRPHPSEKSDYYKPFLAKLAVDSTILSGGPLAPILEQVDLVIGGGSTAMVEAFALGIPVMCVQFARLASNKPYDGQSGLEVITEPAILRQRVEQFLTGEWQDTSAEILQAYTGPLDGQATQRTLDTLAEITA